MMTPCRKLYYAVEAVVYIAYHSDKTPISSRDIARMQGLPARHLEQIMQKLVHGKVLRGMRGPKGGYVLAKSAKSITLAEICYLVNDEDIIQSTPQTTDIGNHIVRPFWSNLHNEIAAKLDGIDIASLCAEAVEKKLPKLTALKIA
ncbi:MAG: Rrf2 family transcriptional regulator [Alphaproteobacteria bacterium]|nr:Rrf2 family transcriptional regulator [Alphaproteobacteria bacterium]